MKGFTLFEVIVALIIAGIAAAALFDAVGTGLRASQTASRYDEAIVRARSRLAAATHGTALMAGDWRGQDGGGFSWRLRVSPGPSAALQTEGLVGPRAGTSVKVVLYDVSVWVGWNDGAALHEVRLDTKQVGG